MAELRTYKVESITFENKVPNGTQLKLKNEFSYNVNYFGEEKRCVGKLVFRISDEQLRPFSLKIEMEALFTYTEEETRENIHAESFSQIFPFVRQIINTTTAMSGIPGLMIPMAKIDPGSVRVAERAPEDGEQSPLN